MIKPPTILVLDSGLGGLTVLREVVKLRPDAHYTYVADDLFFPYGHHTEEEIIARVVPLAGQLIDTHRPDLVVIACNTMSVSVMAPLRAAYQVPFVGTVPAIKPACAASITRRVSVLGTKGTVKREYTQADKHLPGHHKGHPARDQREKQRRRGRRKCLADGRRSAASTGDAERWRAAFAAHHHEGHAGLDARHDRSRLHRPRDHHRLV